METLGRRIARLRLARGYTQQQLADRAAISRVALSHIEADMSWPGERTVVLLAGLLRVEPPDLVRDTPYPQAKAERLPTVACRYTEVELQLRLFDAALESASTMPPDSVREWRSRLEKLLGATADHRERSAIQTALRRLSRIPARADSAAS